MNELVPIGDIERMAQAIAKSGLFGLKTADQAFALMLVAQATGLHPAAAARDYDIIQGRPAKRTEAMLRDFLSSGGRVEWHELSDAKAEATFAHPAGGQVRIDWTLERAKKAGLAGKDIWQKFPRAMLRSRCVSEGVRTVFPAATSGMYVPEEVEQFAPEKHLGMAEVVDRVTGEITPEAPKTATRSHILTPAPPAPAPESQPMSDETVQEWLAVVGMQPNEIMLNDRRDIAMAECKARGDRAAAQRIAAAVKDRRAELRAKAAAATAARVEPELPNKNVNTAAALVAAASEGQA